MKKRTKILIIVALLFVIIRITGGISFFHLPSSSNEPNLKVNSYIIGSGFVFPKAFDFAYFRFSDSLEGSIIIKRLIALPGDKLECKNGTFFVNNVNVDQGFNLRYGYKISQELFKNYIEETFRDDKSFEAYPISNDSVLTFLDDAFVKNLPIKIESYKDFNIDNISKDILSKTSNWNMYNFGPIELQEGKYFFLGDSRDNSFDSRYRGFVDEENILGTLLIKF